MDKSRAVVLTGGIASGKTAVSDAFAMRGVPIIDTDLIAREVVAPGSVGLTKLVHLTGVEILTPEGQLDRRQLRLRIIAEPGLRQAVEAALHPQIEALSLERITNASGVYCLVVVPLFVESGRFRWAQRVLVVDVPEELQIQRLMARDQMTLEQAQALLAAQASRAQRLAVATETIDNNASLTELESKVEHLHQFYRHCFSQQPNPNTP